MKKIDAIKFLSYDYEIELTEDKIFTEANAGHVSISRQTITLSKDLIPIKLQQTLFHELVHIIEKEFLLNLTENQVILLSEGLFHILKENDMWKDFKFKKDSTIE